MERLDNVGDWENQSNSNGNKEIQFGGTQNHRNPLDPICRSTHVTKRIMLHTQRVTLILSKKAPIEWEYHWSTTIKTKEEITMNFIQCYASTNDDDDKGQDNQCSRSQCISGTQNTQGKKQDPQIQHEETNPITLDGKALERWKLSRTWAASSVNKENPIRPHTISNSLLWERTNQISS
ncbi:unnamed protein product [Schistosoma margrebowiei]|uniref:Uncharacterized protein n=1 Tax=Schistosoma margrebowiei TaxID=48269 RepID=A0A183LG78_9TREM|nr:unnamed protein product [Schistosoma margrebowiei]